MKSQDYTMKFLKYLKKEMNQEEVTAFEALLKNDMNLQKDFLMERSIFIAAREAGRKEVRNRLTLLEAKRKPVEFRRLITPFEIEQQWIASAAFMNHLNINASSLPVSDETLADFLEAEED